MSQESLKKEEAKKITALHSRANMLFAVRSFFAKKKVLEVDPPLLSRYPALDLYIEPMEVNVYEKNIVDVKECGYLHTSPEYMMKKLLSIGIGDIYYLGHVFRKEEIGAHHNSEFTMIEWYRYSLSYEKFLEEVIELISLFISPKEVVKLSYKKAFERFLSIDPFSSDLNFLKEVCIQKKISLPDLSIANEARGKENLIDREMREKDLLLQLLMSEKIEPQLDTAAITIIDDFPASQAALAQIERDRFGNRVGKRFEFYVGGLEIGNGYFELSDSIEQKKRFLETNRKRVAIGKTPLPIDEPFLKALEKGIGSCLGIAVGFDRLMMLKEKANQIEDILAGGFDS